MDIKFGDPIFHDPEKAMEHIEHLRWPGGQPVCPYCSSARVHRMGGKTQAGILQCNDCREKFTVRTGTVMQHSHVPLHKWLLATQLMTASQNGVTPKQMQDMLDITYKTAWFLCRRIREAMDGVLGQTPTGETGP
jgi:transposase-like protein